MQVKSIVAGVANGISGAIEVLDKGVKELGDKKIYSCVDTAYTDPELFEHDKGGRCPKIVRVIIYDEYDR